MKKIVFALSALFLSTTFITSCKKDTTTTLMGNWVEGSQFDGHPRSSASVFVINNKAYMVGGFDGDDYYKDTWEFDPDLNWWKQVSDFPGSARSSAVAFTINGKGYFGTGFDGDVKLKDFWEFDPNVDPQWTRKADFGGLARYGAVGFGLDNYG